MALFGRSKPEPPAPTPAPLPEPKRLGDGPAGGEDGRRSVDEHRDYLLSYVTSLRPFGIGLMDATGLTLCESISSDIDLPVFTSSRVDGWAVRASNLVGAAQYRPIKLPVVGEVTTGGYRAAPLTPGTALRITAGAPVPEGSDAVVAQADGVVIGEDVEFRAEASFHDNMLVAGARISDGELLVAEGTVLEARTIGLLAEVGIDKILARPRPRVVILSLGSELVEPGLPLERLYQTYDAATLLLAATARGDGAQVFPIGVASSVPAELRLTLSEQLVRADLVLVSGDPSPELASVLGELGQIDEAQLAIEPAVPGLFAVIGDDRTPVLVLPRDPVSAYIGYQALGRPLVRKLAGTAPTERDVVTAPTTAPLETDPGVTTFLLAHSSERGVAPVPAPEGPTGKELVAADTLIVVGPGTGRVAAHQDATCWVLKG